MEPRGKARNQGLVGDRRRGPVGPGEEGRLMNWEDPAQVKEFNEVWSAPQPMWHGFAREARQASSADLAGQIGMNMARVWPAVAPSEGEIACAVPADKVEVIAEVMMAVVAEMLQAWLNAGSEREVTLENEDLRQMLVDKVRSWSGPKKGD